MEPLLGTPARVGVAPTSMAGATTSTPRSATGNLDMPFGVGARTRAAGDDGHDDNGAAGDTATAIDYLAARAAATGPTSPGADTCGDATSASATRS